MQQLIIVHSDAPDRFTSRAAGIPEVSAEGKTEAEALAHVKKSLTALFASSKVVSINVPLNGQSNPWLDGFGRSASDPDFAAYRAELKAEALHRLVASPLTEQQRFLLCECVDAYLPLEGPQLSEFQRLLLSERYKEMQMTGTIFGQGMVQGQRVIIQEMLEQRFGPLSPHVLERLSVWPPEQLRELGKTLLSAKSLRELGLEDANA